MVTARELRKGNLVASHVNEKQKEYLSDEFIYVVEEIKSLKVNVTRIEDGAKHFNKSTHLPYDKIFPIKLSQGWLERIGFKQYKKFYWTIDLPLAVDMEFTRINLLELTTGMLPTIEQEDKSLAKAMAKRGGCVTLDEIRYVHKLQNLFFSLTEVELIK